MDDPIAVSRQRMVDDVHAWTMPGGGRYIGPSKLKRLFRWFVFHDLNCYFSILTHLSLEPGYTLDYVHQPARVPQIYARRKGERRCRDWSQVRERAQRRTSMPEMAFRSGNFAYLSHITTDDSEDGFFQLIVLGIMGAQFLCYDHAAYNDWKIVCTHAALDASLVYLAELSTEGDAAWIHREANAFDLAPHVQMGDDAVTVRVALFSAWSGLHRCSYTVRRAFPHHISPAGRQQLVEYNCGICF